MKILDKSSKRRLITHLIQFQTLLQAMEDDFEYGKLHLSLEIESCEKFDGMLHVGVPLMCYSASLRIRSPESCARVYIYESSKTSLYSCTCHMLCAHVHSTPQRLLIPDSKRER